MPITEVPVLQVDSADRVTEARHSGNLDAITSSRDLVTSSQALVTSSYALGASARPSVPVDGMLLVFYLRS